MASNKYRQKNPKNRQTKHHLLFDDENRRDFLTGFQKRKKERKRVAREHQELKYKEEKQRLRQEARKARLASWQDLHFPDELVEKSQQPIVYDHPEHTVTVESVGSVIVEHMDLLAAHGGIGENKVEYDDDEDGDKGVQSRLKSLDEDDDDSDEDETTVEAQEANKKSQFKKKSANLQKMKSKLVRPKRGRSGRQKIRGSKKTRGGKGPGRRGRGRGR